MDINKRDLQQLGSQLDNLIDHAISSNNFKELSHSIDSILKDQNNRMNPHSNYRTPPRQVPPQENNPRQGNNNSYNYNYGYNYKYSNYNNPSAPPRRPARQTPRQVDHRFTNYPAGQISGAFMTFLGFGGASICLASGIAGLISGLLWGFMNQTTVSILIILFGLCCLGVGIAGNNNLKRVKRFRFYRRILGAREYCSLKELSEKSGKSLSFLKKDLTDMFRRRFFPQGHLDEEGTSLILTDAVYQQYLSTKQAQLEQQQLREAERKKMDDTGMTPEARKLIEEGESYIRYIHRCNDELPGELISEKLSRLELVITRIFDEVKKRPELAPELRKFMSYYLPTTKKLLNAYLEFERQEIRTANVISTQNEIEETLDTINTAFENLLDSFFQDTAWDISSDISVLQSMFAQEGLTGSHFDRENNNRKEEK